MRIHDGLVNLEYGEVSTFLQHHDKNSENRDVYPELVEEVSQQARFVVRNQQPAVETAIQTSIDYWRKFVADMPLYDIYNRVKFTRVRHFSEGLLARLQVLDQTSLSDQARYISKLIPAEDDLLSTTPELGFDFEEHSTSFLLYFTQQSIQSGIKAVQTQRRAENIAATYASLGDRDQATLAPHQKTEMHLIGHEQLSDDKQAAAYLADVEMLALAIAHGPEWAEEHFASRNP